MFGLFCFVFAVIRLSAEKVNLPQNGAQSVVQNAHNLSARPDQ